MSRIFCREPLLKKINSEHSPLHSHNTFLLILKKLKLCYIFIPLYKEGINKKNFAALTDFPLLWILQNNPLFFKILFALLCVQYISMNKKNVHRVNTITMHLCFTMATKTITSLFLFYRTAVHLPKTHCCTFTKNALLYAATT